MQTICRINGARANFAVSKPLDTCKQGIVCSLSISFAIEFDRRILSCFFFLWLAFQVIKWIEEHGETFLVKHTGVGKSLVKAEALLKRHEEFESIAQVSNIAISQIDRFLVSSFLPFGVLSPTYIFFNQNKRKSLHKNRVQFPED